MKTKTKVVAIGGAVVAGAIVVAARFLPGKEVEIIGLYYFDGTTWIGLPGAVFEPEAVVFGGKCKNLSSVPLNVVIEFRLVGPDDYMAQETFTDTIAPNEEVTYPYSALLGIEGEYTLTVTMYEEGTMRELDRMTVGVLVTEEVVPAEFTLSGLRFLSDTIQAGGVLTTFVTVTNTGGEAGAFTAFMTGALTQNRTSQVLSPGQSEELMFYQAVDLPGSPAGITYNIEIDGGAVNGPLTGSFTITEEVEPAQFVLSELSITPPELQLGEQVVVSVRVDNVGEESGLFQMVLQATGEEDKVREYVIGAGGGMPIAFSWYPNTVGLNTVTAIGPTNTLPGTFTVTGIEAAGHILAIMADLGGGEWGDLDGREFQLNQTVPLVVSWKSDMGPGDPSVRGHVSLQVRRADGQLVYLTPTSGQDSILAPGQAGQVYFEVNFFQLGSWYFYAILSGETV